MVMIEPAPPEISDMFWADSVMYELAEELARN